MEEADESMYTEVKVEIDIAEEPVPLYLTDLCTGVSKDVRADRAVPAWTVRTTEGDAVANGHSDIVVKTEAGEEQPGLLHDFSHEKTWTGKCLPAPNSERKEGWGTWKPGESEHNEYPSAPELSVEDLKTRDTNPERPHACPLCHANYKNSWNLREHMFKHTGEKDHACEKCDDKFSLPNLLRHHMRIHSGQRPYKCPHCDASFMQPRTLTLHLRKGHPTLYKYSSAAERNVAVADSVRNIDKTLEKPYTCHLCTAAYKNSSNLKEHMFKHTGEKAHACAKCDDKFSTLQHLKSHMQIHSGQRPHKCPHCDATFMQPRTLTLHLRKGHPTLYKFSSAAEWNVAVADSVRTIDRTLEKPYSSHPCTAVANGHSDIVVKTDAGEEQPGLLHDFSHETTWAGKCLPALNSEGKEGWGTWKPGESEHNEYPSAPELSVEDLRTSDKNPERPHACPLCPANYMRLSHLKEHMFKHKGEKDYACEKCDATFSMPQYLRKHMQNHSGQRPHACPLCPAAYKQANHLKEHMFKHTGEKAHACKKCDEKFSLPQNLKKHMLTHSGQRPHKCPHCDATFMKPSNLKRHKQKGHPTLYGYSSAAEWNVTVAGSVRTIDRTLEKPYSSHMCTAVANGHSDIVVKTEAREDQPGLLHDFSHETTWTGKCLPAPNSEGKEGWGTWKPGELEHNEYPSAPELSVEDLKTSDKNPERPHACPLCPANYKNSANLKEHMIKHTGQKPHFCEKCDDKFSLRNHLRQHMRIHSGQRPYKCPHCDATFMQPRTLTLHLRKGHPTLYGYSSAAEWNVAVADSVRTIDRTLEKPYTCHLCSAAYRQSHHLRDHMYKHTGEKAHACAKCDVAFSLPQHLKRHMLSHTGQRPYKCQHCDASFLRPDYLKRHMQVGHPKLSNQPSATEVSVGVESSTSGSNSNLDSPAAEVNTLQNEVSSTECNWVVVKLEPDIDM